MIFLESPWPILIVGLVLETVLAIVLFRTGRGAVVGAMAGVALLVLLGVLTESWTLTDTKRIRQTLEAAAAGLRSNNVQQVDACIVPDADGDAARGKTRWALSCAEFQELTIRNLEVKFNYRTSPPTAETTFTVWVRGNDRSGTVPGEISRPVAMNVTLRKESGRWLIFGEPKHDVRE
ncbi:MAG: hypothetical protein ACLP9L_23015 [Thermoguttaceae bacterium]